MNDALRLRIAALHLKTDLIAAGLDSEYAAMQSQLHASRVTVDDDGGVDAAALATLVNEIRGAADQRWQRQGPDDFYTELRRTIAERRARQRGEPDADVEYPPGSPEHFYEEIRRSARAARKQQTTDGPTLEERLNMPARPKDPFRRGNHG